MLHSLSVEITKTRSPSPPPLCSNPSLAPSCLATLFLEAWKRRQFKLNYEWDLVDYDEERDMIRPEFEAKVTRERINPITKKMEPFLSARDRCTRVCFSAVTVFFWVNNSPSLFLFLFLSVAMVRAVCFCLILYH